MAGERTGSTLKFYKVAFDNDLNAYVDNLDGYLETLTAYEINNFQYIRNDLNIEVKINLSQTICDSFDYNYCSIVNFDTGVELETYYYYIKKVTQVAQNTLNVSLMMDTVNSLGQGNSSYCNPRNFTKETEIQRQHDDRFCKRSDWTAAMSGLLNRKIDKTAEDIQPLTWNKTVDNILVDPIDDDNWYVIYSAPPIQEAEEPSKVLNIALCADTQKTMSAISSTTTIRFVDNGYYYNDEFTNFTSDNKVHYIITPNIKVHFNDLTLQVGKKYKRGNFEANIVGIAVLSNSSTTVTGWGDLKNSVLLILDRNEPLVSATSRYIPVKRKMRNYTDGTYGDNCINITAANLLTSKIVNFSASSEVALNNSAAAYVYYSSTLTWTTSIIVTYAHIDMSRIYIDKTLKSIGEIDKANELLVKIVALPYCPIDISYLGGKLILADAKWEIVDDNRAADNGCIRYTDKEQLPTLARSNVLSMSIFNNLCEEINLPTLQDAPNDALESKLYSSQFKTTKFNYDTFNKLIMFERFYDLGEVLDLNYNMPIDYKVSNNLSSEFAFRFNKDFVTNYYQSEDYDDYLIINRNQELPVYSSQYLNYIRNGYNFDKKQQALASDQNITRAAVSAGTSIASGAVLGSSAGPVGIAVGAIIGATSAAINIAQQEARAYEALNNKLAQLAAQGISVSGASDLDILKWYSDNKLHYIEYEPTEEFKKAAVEYFRLYGYKRFEINIPRVDSRIWYNYIQCVPGIDFEGTKKYKLAWLTDLKQKYQNGVTVFHHHNIGGQYDNWDFDRNYENYETWIIEGVANE